ncbi:MAG: putative rane protein [Solirubrobacteraceae bacterium]|jgi:cytochrome c oxidase assembly factor CtaG|nr:putative rane protein [Solirubrobacteraceae bacterium]
MLAATSVAPGFWDWSLDPPLVLVLVTAALYAIGDRRTVTPERAKAARRAQRGCFYGGLVVLLIALASPIDALAEQLFWVHMIQHMLLLVVAAPLIVLAQPWNRLWRGLSLDLRRRLARGLAQGERTRWLRSASRTLGSPAAGFMAFSVVLLAWHVPALFDATLRSPTLHALEHTLFLATAVMFWKQAIDSPPLRAPLSSVQRVAYLVGAMVVSWVLAVVLALASTPLYAHYAHEASRPGGISALTDQQLAAGVMWVPGSITFVIVIFAYVHRWLAPQSAPASPGAVTLAGDH